jgi:hypothetical protein
MPWAQLLVARVQVLLRHHGLTAGSLVVDATDTPRAKSAKALAYREKLRDKARGGSLWGHRLVVLVLVTPNMSMPVGGVCSQPAPELSAWYNPTTSFDMLPWVTPFAVRKESPVVSLLYPCDHPERLSHRVHF